MTAPTGQVRPSRLYFTNEEGSSVWQIPDAMGDEAFVTPLPID